MPYVGNPLADAYSARQKQDLTGQSGTTFTLTHSISSPNDLSVYINHVRQEPTTAYTVNGTVLETTGTVAGTDDFYIIYDELAIQSISHPTNQALTATAGTFTSGLVGTTATFSGALSATTGTFSGAVDIQGQELILDADADTSITADTDDEIHIKIGGADDFKFKANTLEVQTGSNIDMNGTELILDADGDSSITADTDDQIDFKVNNIDTFLVGQDYVRIKGVHPDLYITDTDDGSNNDGGMFYNNGVLSISADHSNVANNSELKFFVDGSEKMKITRNGYITKPYQPAFHVTNATGASAFSGNSICTWNHQVHNNGGDFKMSAGTGQYQRFTAPVAGYYFFNAQMISNSGVSMFFGLRKNGTLITGTSTESYLYAAGHQSASTHAVVYLALSDYVEVYMTANYAAYGGTYANFNGFLIG